MKIQFSIRSLLIATFLLAALLSLCSLCDLLRRQCVEWVDADSSVYLFATYFSFRGASLFWLTLLMPCWFPALFVKAESRWERTRPFLNLLPAMWYVELVELQRNSVWRVPTKVAVVTVTLGVLALIWLTSRRGLYVLTVPLAFAIASGTIWLVIAFP